MHVRGVVDILVLQGILLMHIISEGREGGRKKGGGRKEEERERKKDRKREFGESRERTEREREMTDQMDFCLRQRVILFHPTRTICHISFPAVFSRLRHTFRPHIPLLNDLHRSLSAHLAQDCSTPHKAKAIRNVKFKKLYTTQCSKVQCNPNKPTAFCDNTHHNTIMQHTTALRTFRVQEVVYILAH
jgi:hypothetical protein